MSHSDRMPTMKTAWYQEWNPSRRPIQLQLPVLSYESNVRVWQEKAKTILRYAAVSGFIEAPLPCIPDKNTERWAAATYCLALLESSISEDVLADLITLSAGGELSQDPYVVFAQAKRLAEAVEAFRKHSNPAARNNLWDALRGRRHYQNFREFVGDLDTAPKNHHMNYNCFILVVALLVKRHFPYAARQFPMLHQLTSAALVLMSTPYIGADDWIKMMNELKKAM